MKTKKTPMRTCVVTKQKYPKKELIRIVRNKEGFIQIDETGKANGRGAYLKKEEQVILTAKEKKILNKHLETEIPDNIFDELLELIKEKDV